MDINGHTLLPVLANWAANSPEFTLSFDTEIAGSLRGYEQRGALRTTPRAALSFSPSVHTEAGYAALRGLLVAGLRFDPIHPEDTPHPGQFCAPWAGRESWLMSADGAALTIAATAWPWAVGDWLIVFDAAEKWGVAQVTDVADDVLTVDPAPAGLDLGEGDMVIPLFFGRLNAPELDLLGPNCADFKLELIGSSYAISSTPPATCDDEEEWLDAAYTPPTPAFTAAVSGMDVTFNAGGSTAGSETIAGYEWDFGDGFIGVGTPVTHTYQAAGDYTAVLTVRDATRRWATTTQTITVS